MTKHLIAETLRLDYPTDPDKLLSLREEDTGQPISFAHAHGVESVANTVIQMIRDGVVVSDGDKAAVVAQKMKDKEHEMESGPWRFQPAPKTGYGDHDSGIFTLESGLMASGTGEDDSGIFTLDLEEEDLGNINEVEEEGEGWKKGQKKQD